MMLVITYFIWKAQLMKGDFLKRYWPTRGELKLQDGPMWLPNTFNLYNYGGNFIGYNFQLNFSRFQPSPSLVISGALRPDDISYMP